MDLQKKVSQMHYKGRDIQWLSSEVGKASCVVSILRFCRAAKGVSLNPIQDTQGETRECYVTMANLNCV